jgi:tetratricopeptide (TPR) repeat protein
MRNKLIHKYFAGFILLLILTGVDVFGQDTLTGLNVEQKSYQLYQDKKWKDLVKFGNTAIKEGYNYFYIQMRVGIAYFEKKQYCLAESHFKKALSFSSNDELAQEYLYYCYIYMGRTEDARMLSKHFSKELAAKTGITKQSTVGFVMFEGGTKISDSAYYYDKGRGTSSNYFNPAAYFQLGLEHGIKKRISLYHAATYFSQQNFIGTLRQIQYYLRAAVPIKNNWLISPSFHYVNINFASQIIVQNPPIIGPFGYPIPAYPPTKTETTTTNSNYFVGSLAIQKIIKRFTLSVGSTISNISNKTEYINSGSLYYSVLGNSRIVLGCTGYLHTVDNYVTTYVSAAPFIYLQPAKSISVKLSYLTNAGNNIIEDNGYFINNSPDLTKSRFGVLANFSLTNSVSLYGLYQLEFKQENIQQFNYRYNVIVAGIKIVLKKG